VTQAHRCSVSHQDGRAGTSASCGPWRSWSSSSCQMLRVLTMKYIPSLSIPPTDTAARARTRSPRAFRRTLVTKATKSARRASRWR
jgi:hypothetical protein